MKFLWAERVKVLDARVDAVSKFEGLRGITRFVRERHGMLGIIGIEGSKWQRQLPIVFSIVC